MSRFDRLRRYGARRQYFPPLRRIVYQRSILSGTVGGRAGRAFAASMLAREDLVDERVRTQADVVQILLTERSARDPEMQRFVYACYLLRLEYGQRYGGEGTIAPPGLSTLLVQRYPPAKHRFHVADPSCPSFSWHTEGQPIL